LSCGTISPPTEVRSWSSGEMGESNSTRRESQKFGVGESIVQDIL